MSYQVIALKWRPQSFDEVTGQEPITRTLQNAIENERLHHAYIFSGARGVGKTTSARLFAKALNCHKTAGPNVSPCRIDDADACPSCAEISESRSLDVLEIDAASHTGIDSVRDTIIEGINISPARDRFKIFIIDEVHQLSKAAFNALLKTLEEPPPNVVFIMATTELHKVPDTILSRCQQFEFRTIALQKIFERLRLIADAEKVAASDAALREVARSGEGSMRDAQSNFDQVISYATGEIDVETVSRALGIAGTEMLLTVSRAAATGTGAAIFGTVDDLVSRGHDLRAFARDLLALFRDVLVLKIGGSEQLIESAALSRQQLAEVSELFSESDLIRYFNSLSETEAALREAVNPRYTLEIGLMKLAEMKRLTAVEDLIGRLGHLSDGAEPRPASAEGPAGESEKKTLNTAEALDPHALPLEKPDQTADDLPAPEPDFDIREATELPEELAVAIDELKENPFADPDFLKSAPVKLPPIRSEDLEHVDDAWLDAAFERKLLRSGDDLRPLPAIESMVRSFAIAAAETKEAPNGHAAQTIAAEYIARLPEIPQDDGRLPELPADPTETELLEYARQHPAVKRALRVFRGELVEVSREPK